MHPSTQQGRRGAGKAKDEPRCLYLYQPVGDAYVQRIMDGEVLSMAKEILTAKKYLFQRALARVTEASCVKP